MATRSTITAQGRTIYCHWDGYPSHNGNILKACYNTPEAITELMALGNLSILGCMTAPPEGLPHSFENPADGVCVAYHRDRGEEWRDYGHFNFVKDEGEEFNYLWDGVEWLVRCSYLNDGEVMTITNALKADEEVKQ